MATKGFSGSGDIIPPERIGATTPIGEGERGTPTSSFQAFMQQAPANPLAQAGPGASMSPFDLAHGPTTLAASPSYDTILTQVGAAQNTLGGVQNQLSTPNLRLNQSQRYVVKNKLNDANEAMSTANAKLGTGDIPTTEAPEGATPVQKFLALVANGQMQMESAKNQLGNLQNSGQNITPGDMLMIQIKLNKAQQLIEFASVVLGKAVDDIKQLLNIQL